MKLNYLKADIKNSRAIELFKDFYERIIIPSFDINERETYEQFIENLTEPDENGNSYSIVLILDEGEQVIGGVIYDYFADTNIGYIEYIATDGQAKQKGIGTYAFKTAIEDLNNKAKANGFDRVEFIAGEVEKEEAYGKQAKHYFWEKFGYKALDFNYVQPPLAENKEPVYIMRFGIMTKAPNAEYNGNGIKKDTLKSILNDYFERGKESKIFSDMISKIEKKSGDYVEFMEKENYFEEER